MRLKAVSFPTALTELTAAWQDVGSTPVLHFDGGPVLLLASYYITNATGADVHVYDGLVLGTNAIPGMWGGIWVPSGQTIVHNLSTIIRVQPGLYQIVARARGSAAAGDTLAADSSHIQIFGLNELERDPTLFQLPT